MAIKDPDLPTLGCFSNIQVEELPCLLCDLAVSIIPSNQPYLKHLLTEHKLVIAENQNIIDFKRYVSYWKKRFKGKQLEEFCPVICTNSDSETDNREYYYLLCDSLPEDSNLRKALQFKRLEHILNILQNEHTENEFSRGCLFCKKHFLGNKQEILSHLSYDHNLHLGHPDNIVFVREYLDLIENKLESCQCLYCEKIFKDKMVLKEHMRKKFHKQINPNNPEYDRFYVVNYLESGKSWKDYEKEEVDDEPEEDVSQESDYSDWLEAQDSLSQLSCLFCLHGTHDVDELYDHMSSTHQFNFKLLISQEKLSFYDQVKLVNYIRSEVADQKCPYCNTIIEDSEHSIDSLGKALTAHIYSKKHEGIPDRKLWDQYQYFFPNRGDDLLLSFLDDE